MKNPGGRGGSFFYFTTDKRFIIKSLSKDEKDVLLRENFLKSYYENLEKSLLARIYGVYKIKTGDKNPFSFMLLGNIASPEFEVISIFDIKGSKVGRKVSDSSVRS